MPAGLLTRHVAPLALLALLVAGPAALGDVTIALDTDSPALRFGVQELSAALTEAGIQSNIEVGGRGDGYPEPHDRAEGVDQQVGAVPAEGLKRGEAIHRELEVHPGRPGGDEAAVAEHVERDDEALGPGIMQPAHEGVAVPRVGEPAQGFAGRKTDVPSRSERELGRKEAVAGPVVQGYQRQRLRSDGALLLSPGRPILALTRRLSTLAECRASEQAATVSRPWPRYGPALGCRAEQERTRVGPIYDRTGRQCHWLPQGL